MVTSHHARRSLLPQLQTGNATFYLDKAVARWQLIDLVLFNATAGQWFDYLLDVSAPSTEVCLLSSLPPVSSSVVAAGLLAPWTRPPLSLCPCCCCAHCKMSVSNFVPLWAGCYNATNTTLQVRARESCVELHPRRDHRVCYPR